VTIHSNLQVRGEERSIVDQRRPRVLNHGQGPALPGLSRRLLLGGSGAAVATATLAGTGLAQGATPGPASPVAVDPAAFRELCAALTGASEFDAAGLEQLQGLIEADEQLAEGLQELLAMGDVEFDMRDITFPALGTVFNIVQFWYLGNFQNAPLENRAERIGTFVSWQALPYVTTPAVCKAFGYWATDPGLAD
jgi:hypothetical protein